MTEDRVVLIDGPQGRGSGYAIGPSLVLTSAHVVCDAAKVPLCRPGGELVPGTVVWRGAGGGRDDAALVHVDAPDWKPSRQAGARWGEFVTDEARQECEAWGAPKLAEYQDARTHRRVAELQQVTGAVNPGSGYLADRYVVSLDPPVPEWPREGLPWGGLSGAALVSRGFVLGVVAAEAPFSGHGVLEAVPSYLLMRDAGFRAALRLYGADSTQLEPVEFDELIAREPAGLGRPGSSPSALLRPEREAVGFHGRAELLADLIGWCRQDGLAALLVHGPGGEGKTRLVRELAARLTSDLEQRWAVVWLRATGAPTGQRLDRLQRTRRPVLVVLDYAENRLDQLALLLEETHRRAEPFKVLLLARTAGDWWEQAQRHTSLTEELLPHHLPVALPPLAADPGARPALYRAALDAYAARLGGPWPAVAATLPERDLDHPGFANMLTLHMTALVNLLDAGPADDPQPPTGATGRLHGPTGAVGRLHGPTDPDDVESRLLNHEDRYWRHVLALRGVKDLAPEAELFKDALAAATLLGAGDEVLTLVGGLADEWLRGNVGDWLADAYPPDRSSGAPWGAVQPDRLAERFAGERVLKRHHLLPALIAGLDRARAERLLTVLTRAAGHRPLSAELSPVVTRLCADHPDQLAGPALAVAPQVERPAPLLAALDAVLHDLSLTIDQLAGWMAALPTNTYHLGPWAVRVAERLVALRREQADGGGPALLALVTALRELSKRHFDTGDTARALPAVEEAIALLEPATVDHGHDGPSESVLRNKLAGCLANRAAILSNLGRPGEALAPAIRAEAMYRELADRDEVEKPEQFPIALAILARVHDELGDPLSALPLAQEVVALREPLARSGAPDAVADLARGLNNLALQYAKAGQAGEALAHSRHAVALLRPLARQRPDAHRALLALALGNLSLCLTATGDSAGALRAAEESVEIRRELAAGRPAAYRSDLALALNSLSIDLSQVGRSTQALAAAEEAVHLCEELIAEQPHVHREQLAMTLNTWSNELSDADRPAEAAEAAARAAALYAELHRDFPEAHAADHAMALTTLGLRLDDLGRLDDSLVHLEQAAGIYRGLPEHLAGPARPDLARCLNNIAGNHRSAGRSAEALVACAEGVALARQLVATGSGDFSRLLARLLTTQALCLHQAGRREEAADVAAEGIDAAAPTAAEPESAELLSALSSVLSLELRTDEALTAVRTVVAARRALMLVDGARHHADLLAALDQLWIGLSGAGRLEEAVEVGTEALAIHRNRWEREPTTDHQAALAGALSGQGNAVAQLGRADKAAELVAESVALWRAMPPEERDAHQPAPALALAAHASVCWPAGRRTEALAALAEAADGFARLPETEQTRHAGTAMVLTTRGSALHDLGDRSALEVLDRAVAAARSITGTGLEAYPVVVAGALLARAWVRADRELPEALADALEGTEIHRRLHRTAPDRHAAGLAAATVVLGLCLARAGRTEEARAATTEALGLVRGARLLPGDLTLPTVLTVHAEVRLLTGTDLEEALAATTESLALLDAIAERQPDLAEHTLARTRRVRDALTATLAR